MAGGKAGGNGREKVANDTMSFATDTAKKTGKSKRTTERKVSIGEKLGGRQGWGNGSPEVSTRVRVSNRISLNDKQKALIASETISRGMPTFANEKWEYG